MKRDLTIATPCFNEAASLPSYFERIEFVRAELDKKGWRTKLLLIDDGSADKTGEIIGEYARARRDCKGLRHPRNLGYGAAIKTALSLAETEWVVFVDADTNYDQNIILQLSDLASDDVDMLNVSIFAPGGRPAYPGYRRWLSRSATLIYRTLLPRLTRSIHTMTCGFRWYKRSTAPVVFPTTSTFVATSEIMLRALQAGLKVVEVPAANAPRRYGQSKMRFVSESLAHVRLAFRALAGRLGSACPVAEHLRLISAQESDSGGKPSGRQDVPAVSGR